MATRNERAFVYRAVGATGAVGLARIRVPYATRSRGDVATGDVYEIRGPGVRHQASVPEVAIQEGTVLRTGNAATREGS